MHSTKQTAISSRASQMARFRACRRLTNRTVALPATQSFALAHNDQSPKHGDSENASRLQGGGFAIRAINPVVQLHRANAIKAVAKQHRKSGRTLY